MASDGYPPMAKSTEASSFKHMNNLAAFYAFIHGEPVPARRSAYASPTWELRSGTQA